MVEVKRVVEKQPQGITNVRALFCQCTEAWLADVRSRFSINPLERDLHTKMDNVERNVRRERFQDAKRTTVFGIMEGNLEPG